MATLKTDDLQEGMKVSKAVEVNGRVIVGPGKELTEKMINLFKAWGVVEVEVGGDHDAPSDNFEEALTPEELTTIKTNIDKRFKKPVSGEIMTEIKNVLTKKNALKLIKNKNQ